MGKKREVKVYLPPHLVDRLDAYLEGAKYRTCGSRSQFLAEAAEEKLEFGRLTGATVGIKESDVSYGKIFTCAFHIDRAFLPQIYSSPELRRAVAAYIANHFTKYLEDQALSLLAGNGENT